MTTTYEASQKLDISWVTPDCLFSDRECEVVSTSQPTLKGTGPTKEAAIQALETVIRGECPSKRLRASGSPVYGGNLCIGEKISEVTVEEFTSEETQPKKLPSNQSYFQQFIGYFF